jgi:leader peptidase (prepilin peptidase) / N-methyltransferase
VELAVGVLWGLVGWSLFGQIENPGIASYPNLGLPQFGLLQAIATMIFLWLLVGIAVMDAEHLWIADAVTVPGTLLGLALPILFQSLMRTPLRWQSQFWIQMGERLLSVFAAAGLILLIRWVYWLIRRREGLGLGDAKLMALLAAWLGLPGALLAFVLGSFFGSLAALVLVVVPAARRDGSPWAQQKLPLGTFLCIGGIVSALWGQPLIALYLRWAGF